ncbi:Transmembrane protein [Senna tora]|uniref:Transmembrane protein n=1 Tax=Senna tora TaxID=362788 RepID=A0A834WNX5_9FABA|nr:Transmembrane protein [Senna tora]
MSARCTLSSPAKFVNANPTLFSNRKPKFLTTTTHSKPLQISLAKADGGIDSTSTSTSTSTNSAPFANDETVFVSGNDVPLEGVIQFEKPNDSSRFQKWGRVALFAGGDVMALLLFATIGRFSHGFSVLDIETLRTADPFIAGWFLSAYFLGGYGEDGRGMNGLSKGVIATAKSWALGIPIGIIIRAAISGHFPNYGFIFVTLGSTAVLLTSCRALLYTVFPVNKSKKSDVYRRGSPFELFELLTSLVRRW